MFFSDHSILRLRTLCIISSLLLSVKTAVHASMTSENLILTSTVKQQLDDINIESVVNIFAASPMQRTFTVIIGLLCPEAERSGVL